MLKRTFIILLVICLSPIAKAQDPQFSQFYAAPLYLNPAFAGSTGLARAGLNYRNQWPSINANFVSYSAYFDYYFDDYNSGLGFMVLSDVIGTPALQQNTISLQYAYQLPITPGLTFRPGAQVAAVLGSNDFSQYVFGDQYDPGTGLPTNPTGETGLGGNQFYMDLAIGGLLYSKNFWFGGAVHHLTEPNQSFNEGTVSELPMKFSLHAGYKIPLKYERNTSFLGAIREVSFTPTIQYKSQGQFDQLDIGTYFTYEPLVVGLWYRGLPISSIEGSSGNESVIVLVGLSVNNFNVGYSFDYTLSELGIRSGGAHELSLSYAFFLGDPSKPPKNKRILPCPKF